MAAACGSEEALADLDLAGMSKKRWHPRAVDIYPAEGGKVAGMEAFLEVNGLTIDGAIAFGGVKNDIEMLERVGTGVAMGNAMDEVKAVADFVTTADRDDGIENALRCFGLLLGRGGGHGFWSRTPPRSVPCQSYPRGGAWYIRSCPSCRSG